MTRHVIVGLTFLVVLVNGSLDDVVAQDSIKAKLDKAKAAYELDVEKARKAAIEFFDKKEETARKTGNKSIVDQVRSERDTFDRTGELSKAVPDAIKVKFATANSTVENAYLQAIKEYTKAGQDNDAAAIETEMKTRGLGTGAFRFSGTWIETHGNGVIAGTRRIDGDFIADQSGKPTYEWRRVRDKILLVDLVGDGYQVLRIDPKTPNVLEGRGQSGIGTKWTRKN